MKIFTSMPVRPLLRAKDQKQNALIDIRDIAFESWARTGLEVISVNTSHELASLDTKSSVNQRFVNANLFKFSVSSTIEPNTPNYLPSFRAMLESALKSTSKNSSLAIINADVVLHPDLNLSQYDSCDEFQFWIGRRTDFADYSSLSVDMNLPAVKMTSNPVYKYGIDAIVVSRSLMARALHLIPDCLTFGLPWWDLMLPVSLVAMGGRIGELPPAALMHIDHGARSWDSDHWQNIGLKVLSHSSNIQAKIDSPGLSIYGEVLANTHAKNSSLNFRSKRLSMLVKSALSGKPDWTKSEVKTKLLSFAEAVQERLGQVDF